MSKVQEQQLKQILDGYEDPETDLDAENPFQLLIQFILSSQTTDVLVNRISPALFAKYPTVDDLANAKLAEVEELISSVSFFRNKAKNIIGTAQKLIKDFNREIPNTMAELTSLPGVGDKVASVILVNIHNKPAIVVDTHVSRVASRLGWSQSKYPIKIKEDLEKLIKVEDQTKAGNALVLFGRYICQAKKPQCPTCPVSATCPSQKTILAKLQKKK